MEPGQGGAPSKASPVPAVPSCHTRRPRGRPAERHRGEHICPGCAFLWALLSSRGDESLLGPARLRGQSRVSRREPASYGFNVLINFNTDAQMRVNRSAAVLSNLPSLFIKTFLPELWLNVMLFKGPLKQPEGFSSCCWNTSYNLLCQEECESVVGQGWETLLKWGYRAETVRAAQKSSCGVKLSAEHQRCVSTFTNYSTLSTWCSCCLLSFSARM